MWVWFGVWFVWPLSTLNTWRWAGASRSESKVPIAASPCRLVHFISFTVNLCYFPDQEATSETNWNQAPEWLDPLIPALIEMNYILKEKKTDWRADGLQMVGSVLKLIFAPISGSKTWKTSLKRNLPGGHFHKHFEDWSKWLWTWTLGNSQQSSTTQSGVTNVIITFKIIKSF